MNKYNLKNILLGFGIGLVFVSIMNLNAGQKKMTVDDIREEAAKYDLIVLEQQEIINKQTQEQSKPSVTPAPTAAPTQASKPADSADITVIIPEGNTSEDIATILFDNGLIKDKKVFLNRLDDLDKSSKLHSGKFSIRKGTGIDAIIKMLTK